MSDVLDMTMGQYRRVYSNCRIGRRINSVSIGAEFLFWRIHNCIADDFGNFLADPVVIRADALTRRQEAISVEQVAAWLKEIVEVALIQTYEVANERYGHIAGFLVRQPANRNGKRARKQPESPWDADELLAKGATDEAGEAPGNPGASGGTPGNPGASGGTPGNPGASGGTPGNPGASGATALDPAVPEAELLRSRGVDEQTIAWAIGTHGAEKVRQLCQKFDTVQARQEIENPSGFVRTLLANGFSLPRQRKGKTFASTREAERRANEAAAAEHYNGRAKT
jgi:hypothetical protein